MATLRQDGAVPRSRWLTLLLAALLCVLGGANRGRVPAHEREGSRTADEPAALRTRGSTVDLRRADEDRESLAPTDAVLLAVVERERAAVPASEPRVPGMRVTPAVHRLPSVLPRGPPGRTSMV
jgi:hypothetical protein